MAEPTVWRLRAEDVAWREVEEDAIVLDLHSSEYVSLNDTAAFLWSLLEKGASADELCKGLTDRWGIDAETARTDVNDFLEECQQANFIQPVA